MLKMKRHLKIIHVVEPENFKGFNFHGHVQAYAPDLPSVCMHKRARFKCYKILQIVPRLTIYTTKMKEKNVS